MSERTSPESLGAPPERVKPAEGDDAVERVFEALSASEASLAEAQRVVHLGSWDWDIVTGTLAWTDEIYRIFGVEPQEFGATYEAFLSYVHPDDREAAQREVDEALLDQKVYSVQHESHGRTAKYGLSTNAARSLSMPSANLCT